MNKLFLALALIALNATAAHADYIIQQPTDTCATRLWYGKNGNDPPVPVPGVNCPTGSFWCVFVPVGGDLTVANYVIDASGNETYSPQPNN